MSRGDIINLLKSTTLLMGSVRPDLTSALANGILYRQGADDSSIELDNGNIIKASSSIKPSTFDPINYFKSRKRGRIGERIAYFPHLKSTEDLFTNRNVAEWAGLAVIADEQTVGRGRKSNQWVSPVGSLSLSFGFVLDLDLEHLAPIQHIVGVAACQALRQITKR